MSQLPFTFLRRAEQLPLDLARASGASRSDVIEAPELDGALELIDSWPRWPSYHAALIGPSGCGKSYLANVWANEVGAARLACADIAGLDPTPFAGRSVLIEHVDIALGGERPTATQTGLFHLLNQFRASDGRVLLTARTPPRAWRITVPDLASRLCSATLVELSSPSETLVEAVLWKLFADRQVEVAPDAISRIATRIERSLSAARDVVGRIDRIALAERRPVTRAVIDRALATV